MDTRRFNPTMLALGNFPYAAFLKRKRELLADGATLYDFSIGDPLDPTPDCIRNHLSKHNPARSQYPEVRGKPGLRHTIQQYLQRRLSITIDVEEELLVHSGSKEAIFHFPWMFSDNPAGRSYVLYGSPGYFVYERGARLAGLIPYPIQLSEENGYLLDLRTIPEEILQKTAYVWLNYPHNPTGTCCTIEYYQEQYAFAQKYELIICSDETYLDLYFETPQRSILEVGRTNVLAFHSCSKRSGMTGYRTGFLAGDATLVGQYASLRNTVGTAASEPIQIAASAAWQDDTHAEERRMLFQKKRDLFMSFLQQEGFSCHSPEATFYLWVKAPEGESGYQYCERMLEQGLIFSPGDFYGDEKSKFFRIALAPEINACKKALQHWKQVL